MKKLNIKSVTIVDLRMRINRIKKNNPTMLELYPSFAIIECKTIVNDKYIVGYGNVEVSDEVYEQLMNNQEKVELIKTILK